MAFYATTTSPPSAGGYTITPGFQPEEVEIMVGSAFGATSSTLRQSIGWTNGTNQFYHSLFEDSTGRQQKSGSDRIVSHWERVGGVMTEVLRVNLNSFTPTQFKFDVITANPNYQLFIRIRG